MNIRFARDKDVDAIAAVHAASWTVTYSDELSSTYLQLTAPAERQAVWRERFNNPKPNQITVVAEEVDAVIGFACVFVEEDAQWGSYLDNLHVSQGHHGQGLGSRLLAEIAFICEARCPGQGLYLSVNQTNHRAQQFYLAQGARNVHSGVWDAPDGSRVPTFRFAWHAVGPLAAKGLR